MSTHHHQTRTSARLANPGAPVGVNATHLYQPPPPTPILRPAEVKRQFSQHADFQAYAKSVKKYLAGTITKTEFHAEMAKILPTKEKLSLHNWLILSILKSAYSDYQAQKKGPHIGGGAGPSHKAQNLRSLSDHFAFKKRMQRTITQSSLSGVSDDAVSMVIVALQQHLLRTLAALRSDQTLNPEIDDVPEDTQVAESSVPGDISSEDIAGAFWRRPSVLCENASLIQYKLSVEQ